MNPIGFTVRSSVSRRMVLCGFGILWGISGLLVGESAQARTPVVFFPGYGPTKLVATVQNQTVAPGCPASGTFEYWFGTDQLGDFSAVCAEKLMTLVYNRQPNLPMYKRFSEQPGVTVAIKNYGRIDSIGPGYEVFFDFLVIEGYTPNQDIRVAGYDWRLTPDIGDFLERTIDLVEQTYSDNGNMPVHLVAHSNGPLYAHYLLTHTTQAWKNKYIHGFTPIAGNWPGQGIFYALFLFAGVSIDGTFPADIESAKTAALMFQSHPATYMTASDPAVFKNQEVVLQAGSVAYTPQHWRKLFRDAGMSLAEELGSYYIGFDRFEQPAYFPNVDVYAEKGSGLETWVGLGLPNLAVGQLIDFSSTQFFILPGDGNQEDITNNSILAWQKMDCFHFELNDNPGVSHMELPSNPDVLDRLLTNLQRPRSVCRSH